MRGRGGLGGRVAHSRASPTKIITRTASSVAAEPCLRESFDMPDTDTAIGPSLTWFMYKSAQAFPSDGTSAIFNYSPGVPGTYAGGMHVLNNKLSLARPAASPMSGTGAYDTPYWGYTSGNAVLLDDLPSQDISVTFTLASVPVTEDPLTSATPVARSWGVTPYLRFDDNTFDGWQLFMGNVNNVANDYSAYVVIYWDAGLKFWDANDPYDDPPGILPFQTGDVIVFTVTGTGATTHITATRNGDTFADLSGSTLSTANGGDFSGLPTATKANFFLYLQGQQLSDEAGPGNSPHYPFFGPISSAMNDTLAIDDVEFCPIG